MILRCRRPFDQTDRLGGDTFLPTDHADSLSALHLHVDEVRIDPEHLRHLLLHACQVRTEPRSLRDNDRIDVHDAIPLPPHLPDHILQQLQARNTLEPLIGAGVVSAQISFTHRSEQRIAEGMDQGIGIGMSLQTLAVGHFNPAENQLSSGSQRMDVIAAADSHLRSFHMMRGS